MRISTIFFLAILLSSSCSPSTHIYKRSQMLMGTIVEISVVSSDEKTADTAMTAAFNEIRRLEEIMSTYIPTSDISKVNAAAGLSPVKVHRDLLLCVRKALEFAELSNGAFNIAIGPAIDLWKVTETDRIPSQAELEAVRPAIDFRNIVVDDAAGTIFLTEKGMRINLGGIGKGFAADYAHHILTDHGIISGIIAVAGDVKVFGKKPGNAIWTIGITHPRKKGEIVAKVHFTDLSISTSGDYERYFIRDGVRYHHILSPETLQPSRGFQGVSIIAEDSATTDALSTAIFAMGPEKGLKLLETMEDVEGIVVLDDGRIEISSGLQKHPQVIIEIVK